MQRVMIVQPIPNVARVILPMPARPCSNNRPPPIIIAIPAEKNTVNIAVVETQKHTSKQSPDMSCLLQSVPKRSSNLKIGAAHTPDENAEQHTCSSSIIMHEIARFAQRNRAGITIYHAVQSKDSSTAKKHASPTNVS